MSPRTPPENTVAETVAPAKSVGTTGADPLKPRSRPRWLVFLASWVMFSALAAVWAIATPISSGPDEPAHFVKAASVVRGELVGPAGEFGNNVQVPQYVAYSHAQTCFAFVPDQPASCAPPVPGDPAEIVTGTTTAGYYNPLYYAVVGWPSLLFQDQTGLYAMRIMSGIFSSLFLALTVVLIASWRRPAIAFLGLATAVTPMVLYLNGLVNPSSLEITATLAAFTAMLSVVLFPSDRLLGQRAAILLVAGIVGANTRGISPFWIALALLLPLIMLSWRSILTLFSTRIVQVVAAVIVLGAVVAVAWTTVSGSLVAGLSGTPQATVFEGVGASPAFGFMKMLLLTFNLGGEMVGNFGWLDTPVPLGVYFVWSALVGGLILVALVVLSGRRLALALGLIVALVFVPPVIQAIYITGGGYIWQGRYTLPIFVCAMVGLGALLNDRFGAQLPGVITRRALWIVGVVWAAAQGAAFLQALRRNTVGAAGSWKDMIFAPAWVPPGGSATLIVAFAVLLALMVVSTIVLIRSSEDRIETQFAPAVG